MCDSLSQSIKAETLGKHYNKRVVECRLAVSLLKRARGITDADIITIKALQDHLGASWTDMLDLISSTLKSDPYTKDELVTEFAVDNLMAIVGEIPHADLVLNTNDDFFLCNRATHVI
jgi:N-acetylgalactosamine kinase